MDVFKSRQDTIENRISKLKVRWTENIQTEIGQKKKWKEQSIRDMWDPIILAQVPGQIRRKIAEYLS